MENTGKLAGKTVFITGSTRGIGRAIALKVAKDGANVVIAAKTATPHAKLPGTIYTVAEEVQKLGAQALAVVCDVRSEQQVKEAVQAAVRRFGGIDILINNASALSPTPTLSTSMKKFDIMQSITVRGTFLVTKECLPYLLKSQHAHILNMSPPLDMRPEWFAPHLGYSLTKYHMSMCVLGWAEEFKDAGIGVNALWPRTIVHSSAVDMLNPAAIAYSRTTAVMADAAYAILSKDPNTCTGNFYIDEDILRASGIRDMKQYAVCAENEDSLIPDFFVHQTKYLSKL